MRNRNIDPEGDKPYSLRTPSTRKVLLLLKPFPEETPSVCIDLRRRRESLVYVCACVCGEGSDGGNWIEVGHAVPTSSLNIPSTDRGATRPATAATQKNTDTDLESRAYTTHLTVRLVIRARLDERGYVAFCGAHRGAEAVPALAKRQEGVATVRFELVKESREERKGGRCEEISVNLTPHSGRNTRLDPTAHTVFANPIRT